MTRKCKWVLKNLIDTKGALGRPITYDNHPTDRDKVRQRGILLKINHSQTDLSY